MPFTQVVDFLVAGVPMAERNLLVMTSGAHELVAPTSVCFLWCRGYRHMQMISAPITKQDATGFGFTDTVLPISVHQLQWLGFDEYPSCRRTGSLPD